MFQIRRCQQCILRLDFVLKLVPFRSPSPLWGQNPKPQPEVFNHSLQICWSLYHRLWCFFYQKGSVTFKQFSHANKIVADFCAQTIGHFFPFWICPFVKTQNRTRPWPLHPPIECSHVWVVCARNVQAHSCEPGTQECLEGTERVHGPINVSGQDTHRPLKIERQQCHAFISHCEESSRHSQDWRFSMPFQFLSFLGKEGGNKPAT